MLKHKINITFDVFSFRQYVISAFIKKCIHTALDVQRVPVPCEINVLVTNDKGIQSINLASRNIDKATDVLSFPMFQFSPGELPEAWAGLMDPDTDTCPLGDMALSLERAAAQANEFGHSIRREIGYLTIHSVLHLLGYDHLDEGQMKAQMREREEYIAGMIPGMQR